MSERDHHVEVICIAEKPVNHIWEEHFAKQGINVTYFQNSQHHALDYASLVAQFVSAGDTVIKTFDGAFVMEAHEKESALAAVAIKQLTSKAKVVWFLHGPDMFCCRMNSHWPQVHIGLLMILN